MREIADRLARLPGVVAVTLGGSRSTGTATEDSDWDFGLYYRGAIDPADVEAFGWPGHVFAPGDWGRIVNGGAWLEVDDVKVDLIYRDLDEVLRWTSEAEQGRFEIQREVGYVAGVATYVLAGELALCEVLAGDLPRPSFPERLRQTAPPRWYQLAAGAAHFAAIHARRGDRIAALANLAQAVLLTAEGRLAGDGKWALNEKGIISRAGLDAVQTPLNGADLDAMIAATREIRPPGVDVADHSVLFRPGRRLRGMGGVERDYRNLITDNRRWERFAHRPGDIFVCTPPKAGTTWMQTIVASLLWPDGHAPGPVMDVAPWFDSRFFPVDEFVGRLEAQSHRRSVKTHTPADGIPWYEDCRYIVVGRDGRDACMSLLNHMANMRPEVLAALAATAAEEGIEVGPRPSSFDVHEFFKWWIGGDFFHHVESFVARRHQRNVLLVHYVDLLGDLEGEMRRVARFLDLDAPEAVWPDVVDRCTFAAMKARAVEINDFDRLFVAGAETFLYRGTNGRWREVLTVEELAAYDLAVAECLSPVAAAWLAGGRSAVSSD